MVCGGEGKIKQRVAALPCLIFTCIYNILKYKIIICVKDMLRVVRI